MTEKRALKTLEDILIYSDIELDAYKSAEVEKLIKKIYTDYKQEIDGIYKATTSEDSNG